MIFQDFFTLLPCNQYPIGQTLIRTWVKLHSVLYLLYCEPYDGHTDTSL